MAIQRIKYTDSQNSSSSYLRHFLCWGIGLFLLSSYIFENVLYAGILSALGIFPALLSIHFLQNRAHRAQFKQVRSHFLSQGYKPEFELKPVLLVDSQTRKLAYFSNQDNSYDLLDFEDILGWEHTWINHTNADTNVWGDKAIIKTSQKQNALILKTRNPHQPIYKIGLRHHSHGSIWMARFDALFSR